jgi:hypothetical protein
LFENHSSVHLVETETFMRNPRFPFSLDTTTLMPRWQRMLIIIITVGQIPQTKSSIRGSLDIIIMHQSLPITVIVIPAPKRNTVRPSLSVRATTRLHGMARQGSREGIGWDTVEVEAAAVAGYLHVAVALGVFAREVEEVDAGEDDEEAAEKGDCVYGVAGVEALEENKRCDEGAGGKGDVVQRIYTGGLASVWQSGKNNNAHVGVELTQSLVKVVHLSQNADDGNQYKDIGAGVSKLVVSGKSQLDGNAHTLDGHDGHGADSAADGNVDERILASVARAHAVDHGDGEDDDQQDVEEKARLDGVIENLVNRLHLLVWRRVQYNDDRADEADGASELAQRAQVLAEKIGS